MANNRKVQAEIDKLLKKTAEGLEAYEELYDKFDNAANPTTKERLEGDLKREIKKLQRQRESIKGYVASSEVKDTKQLEEYRRRIENKMAAFKLCEREMKTKAFSKEGLASAAAEESGSPVAMTSAWLRNAIDEGRRKIEILEFEVQRTKTGGRRAKKDQKSEVQLTLEALQQHFYRWEALLRMVNNEEIDPEEVDDLSDDIQKILSEDTEAGDMPDLDMYEFFDIPPPKPRAEEPSASDAEEKKPSAPPSAKTAPKKTPPATSPSTAAGGSKSTSLTSPNAPSKDAPKTSAPSSAAPGAKSAQSAAPVKAASADAGALEADELEGDPEWLDEALDAANDDTFGDDAMGDAGGVGSLADMATATKKLLSTGGADAPRAAKDEERAPAAAAAAAANNDWKDRAVELRNKLASAQTDAPGAARTAGSPSAAAAAAVAAAAVAAAAAAAPAATAAAPTPAAAAPAGPAVHATGAHGGSAHAHCRYDAVHTLELLDMSLACLPHTLDVERQRPYEPPNAIEPIPYFPQEVHPTLSCRDVYRQFDLETLFFIFYYHQKSYQQYFAAKELKAHSYRYHTDLKRWYQRREKPKETTASSERGAYTYFDYEDTWQRQNVDDFTFDYKFLEDDLN